MGEIDRQYLETPFYGSRRMRVWLERQRMVVGRKRVQRLMRTMGLRSIYRGPRTSRPAPEHRVYPYLLRNVHITQPNQVWAADITYLPMARGFLYLVAIMDWHSRYVLSWQLSKAFSKSTHQDIGFLFDDLIIWDRKHEYNNLRPLGHPSVFRINRVHEYILIFQKPR